MTHPITPPPELIAKWVAEIYETDPHTQVHYHNRELAQLAAQWGYQQHERELLDAMHSTEPLND